MTDFYGNPYNNNPYQRNFAYSQQPVVQQPPQIRTNKIFVTSLDDALSRYADPNTIIVYHNQDDRHIYEITTDLQGKKAYKTFVLADFSAQEKKKEEEGLVIIQDAINGLERRITALEEASKKKKGGAE